MRKSKTTLFPLKFHTLSAIFCLILLFGLTSQSAQAHADIIRAEPIDGEVLETAPAELRFWFNEPILPQFSLVQLVDAANQPIANVQVQPELSPEGALVVTLPELEPGAYTVMWRVLSDVDGHLSQGFTLFSTDPALAPAAASQSINAAASTLPTWVEASLRWSNYLLLAALVGALAVIWLVLTPADAQPDAQAAAQQIRLYQRIMRWAATCAAGAFLVGFGLLFWQVAGFQMLATTDAGWLAQAQTVLLETQWGALWLVRQGLLLFLGGGLWLLLSLAPAARSSWWQLLVFGRAIDLMIVQALAGHATAESHNWLLALASATLHLLAAGVWIGGLVALVVIVLPMQVRQKLVAPAWQPVRWGAFSLLAALSVALLFATGLFNMGRQVASIDALIGSNYGRFLLVKIELVLFVGLCGLINTLLLHPKLARGLGRLLGWPVDRQPAWLKLRPARVMALEAALGVLLFGLTGFMTATPPPRDTAYAIDPAQIPKSLTQRVDDLLITLEVTPNRLGQNLINVRGQSARPMSAEILQLYVQLGRANQTAEPVTIIWREDFDQFQVIGNHLTLAGPWRIGVVVQRYNRPDEIAQFAWVDTACGWCNRCASRRAPLAPAAQSIGAGASAGAGVNRRRLALVGAAA
ncbi:MAG: copper resistance protein CopC [Caldilineaceae bacterium]